MTQNSPNGYIAVSEANEKIRETLDSYIGFIKIKGEIASITIHHTGHIYFTLKDEKAQCDGIIFKNIVKPEFKLLKVGDFVYALGTITSYIKTGKISFQVYYISAQGQGNIHYDLSQLKEKLEKEGCFLPQKQLILPKIIKKLAIITSLTGAALKDFLSLIQGRSIGETKILIIPSLMQGEQTAPSVIQALSVIKFLDIQAVLITRGGGAYEDLWGFNDEALARFIASYPLPIISAIGHEQDFTLVDYAAHIRYSTPSSAAYGLFSQKQQIQDKLNIIGQILHQNLNYQIEKVTYYLLQLKNQLVSSLNYKLQQKQIHLQYLYKTLLQLDPQTLFKKGFVMVLDHNQKKFNSLQPIKLEDTLTLQTLNRQICVKVIQKQD